MALIVLIGVSIYAFSDWESFENRYLKKEEDLEHGYYYLETSENCIFKVELLDNMSDFDALYKLDGDSVIYNSNANKTSTKYSLLSPNRVFYTQHKRMLPNGLTYHYGYQYMNDSSRYKRYGMVLDRFKHQNSPLPLAQYCNL